MSAETVTYAFPASLNFILYIWRLRAHSRILGSHGARDVHSDGPEQFARVWRQELEQMDRLGAAAVDGRCLAGLEDPLRLLFPDSPMGHDAFARAWALFAEWWQPARVAYEEAIQPHLGRLTAHDRLDEAHRQVLLTYAPPPSEWASQYRSVFVLPFERIIAAHA
ncbi:hypothetical protein [Alicyclobacillus sendaiensis]|uniref:hypothetical protein n=1 Tax=Alicyclobacillus sendaiensis TaxID=192387 RepID=UPI0007817D9A|nr:hypothetical protein [Alicyclobacillus sendaiensis]